MNKRKPSGFFSKKSDKEIVEYVRQNHEGKNLKELQTSETRLYEHIRRRGLIDLLVKDNVLKRKREKPNFLKDMSDEELIAHISELKITNLTDFYENNSRAYQESCKRGLMDTLLERGIFNRKHRKAGHFSKMPKESIRQYIIEHYKGVSIGDLQKMCYSLYKVVNSRDLTENFIQEGILTRKIRKGGTLSERSDEELMQNIAKKYSGKSPREIEDEDGSLYNEARKRGIINELVKNGVLIKLRRENGIFTSMSDSNLVKYVASHYRGVSLPKLEDNDSTLYGLLYKRGLIDQLIENNILVRGQRKNGFFSSMLKSDLIKYTAANHYGESPVQIRESNGSLYNILLQRKLIDSLIVNGVLTRKQRKQGLWRSLEYTLEEARKAIKSEGWSKLPRGAILSNRGYSSLSYSISKYHGGFSVFRQLLKERTGIPSKKDKLESIVDSYIGEQDDK